MRVYKHITILEENYKFLKDMAIDTKTPNKALSWLRVLTNKFKVTPQELINKVLSLCKDTDEFNYMTLDKRIKALESFTERMQGIIDKQSY